MSRAGEGTSDDDAGATPGGDPVSVRYEFTTRDFDRLAKKGWIGREYVAVPPSRLLEGVRYGPWLLAGFVAIQGLVGLIRFAFFLGKVAARQGARGILPYIIFGGAAVWGLLRLFRWLGLRSWRRAGLFALREITLTSEGLIIVERPLGERRLSWDDVASVGIDGDDVALALKARPPAEWPAMDVFFIPRTAFADPESAEWFAWRAESLRAEAAGPGGGRIAGDDTSATVPGERLAVAYQFGSDDLDRLIEWKWKRRHVRGWLRVFVILELALFTWVLGSQGPDVRLVLPVIWAVIVASYWLTLWGIRRLMRAMWAKAGAFERRSIELSPRGVAVHSEEHGAWQLAWDAVQRTSLESAGVILDVPSRWYPLLVPRRAFNSAEAEGAFVDAAERWRTR